MHWFLGMRLVLVLLISVLANLAAGWLAFARAEVIGSSPEWVATVPAPLPDGLFDPGPRLDVSENDPATVEFEWAIRSWADGRPEDAAVVVRSLLARHPVEPVSVACRALLIELSLARDPRPEAVREAIGAYRRLIADAPNSAIAARARWRIGDLSEFLGLHEEARAAYGLALAQGGSDFDRRRALLGRAVSALGSGRAWEAERDFRLLLQETVDDTVRRHATVGLADSLQAQGRFGEALELYGHAMARWPEVIRFRADSLFRYAEAAAAVGRVQDSRAAYLTVYNISPRHPRGLLALLRIGDEFRRQGNRHHASLFYDHVMEAAHDATLRATVAVRKADMGLELQADYRGHEVEWEVLATVVRQDPLLGSPDEQRRTLEAVAAAHDARVIASEALFRLARQAEFRGTMDDALRAYRRVIERQGRLPDDPWPQAARERVRNLVNRRIADAAAAGDDVAVVTAYQAASAAVGTRPGGEAALLQVAAACARLGLTAEAVRLYRDLSETNDVPIREEALLGLGKMYLDQADFPAAKKVLARHRLEFPLGRRSPDAGRLLAEALDRMGDHPAAARLLRQWLKRFPSHPDRLAVLRMLAAQLAAAGQGTDSLRAYAEAERAGALADPAELSRYAEVLAAAHRYDEAIERYRRVAREAGDPSRREWAALQIARLERDRRRPSEAKAALRELSHMASDSLMKRAAEVLLAGSSG